MFYLYVHTVPNGKCYIGMTNDISRRWNGGKGYFENKDFTKDIELFGWDNIKHEVIDCFENEEMCHMHEIIYTLILNTEEPAYGYNRTNFKNLFLKKYNEKQTLCDFEKNNSESADKNIFEIYNKPYDVAEYLINQWIFNDVHRSIIKDRLLNGYTYDKLTEKYNISIAQIKRICYSSQEKLLAHM